MTDEAKTHHIFGGMRRFRLRRSEDHKPGPEDMVAQGVVFSDGSAVLRWTTKTASTAVYESLDDLLEIHLHQNTCIVWEDSICWVCGTTVPMGDNGRLWFDCNSCGTHLGEKLFLETEPNPNLGSWKGIPLQ